MPRTAPSDEPIEYSDPVTGAIWYEGGGDVLPLCAA